MKKTEWFAPDVKPVHIGAYEWRDRYGDPHVYAYHWWDGKNWVGNPGWCPHAAWTQHNDCGKDSSYFASCCHGWRGLTENAS